MSFASETSVSVAKSRAEIEDMVTRAGAQQFAAAHEPGKATVLFSLMDRRIMFELQLPKLEDYATKLVRGRRVKQSPENAQRAWEQACRTQWRALCLTVKAKLVSAQSGIETFEEAFLAHIVVPGQDGGRAQRFASAAVKAIHAAYTGGTLPPLLGSGS